MNNIYLVTVGYGAHESDDVISVWSSKLLAEEEVKRLSHEFDKANHHYVCSFSINECIVDQQYEIDNILNLGNGN